MSLKTPSELAQGVATSLRQSAMPADSSDPSHLSDTQIMASVLRQARLTEPVPGPATPEPAEQIKRTWTLPGFDRRCRVTTIFGDLPIEALRRHDKVKTLSGAYRSVEWIDVIRLDADFLSRHKEAQPVQVRMRAFGPGQPFRNILVSPGQLICPEGQVGKRTSVMASKLLGLPGICRLPQPEMTYYRFHCGEPLVVSIEGTWFKVGPAE